MLKSIPGILVDGEDNISMAGQSGVLVTINGRQTYMQKDELVSLLSATPASAVGTVEVISNPSAKYDAQGSAGIININMDRRRADGFFMSIGSGVSYWDNLRQNTEISLSYNHNKLTLTTNYSHAIGDYNYYYGMHRVQGDNTYASTTDDTDMRNTIAGNVNLEYRLNKKSTIGGRLDVNTLFGPGITNTVTQITDSKTGTLEQILTAQNDYYAQHGNRYGANAYYTYKPNDKES